MALLMELRRKRPNDERLQRDLPRVITRAARIANEATVRSGRLNSKDGAKGMGIWSGSGGKEEEMALCDQAYPAVLYNAGVYYEACRIIVSSFWCLTVFRELGGE